MLGCFLILLAVGDGALTGVAVDLGVAKDEEAVADIAVP